MAQTTAGLTYVFDENSLGLLKVLRAARADPVERLVDLPSLGIRNGTLDSDVLAQLGKLGDFAMIARDGRMLGPLLQRQAWQASGVTLFLLMGWGQLPLFELSRRLLFLWPSLVAHAREGPQGSAWRVKPGLPSPGASTFKRTTGRDAAA